jgi:hypothetical protein
VPAKSKGLPNLQSANIPVTINDTIQTFRVFRVFRSFQKGLLAGLVEQLAPFDGGINRDAGSGTDAATDHSGSD